VGEPATLAKFGQLEHLQQLQTDGLLYMNPLRCFWKIEDEELRGDPADGIAELHKGDRGEARFVEYPEVVLKLNSWTLRIPPPNADEINVYCMYALRPLHGSFPVDARNDRFGGHALVLLEPQRFIDAVHDALQRDGIRHCAGLVEYYDDDFKGEVGPFKKSHRFRYQSEWRLVCYGGNGDVMKVSVGSLADYSVLMPFGDVNDQVSYVPERIVKE
jgi:hypothetical protein